MMLPYFSFNANANGFGTIEVKVTTFAGLPLLNADVTGEDMGSHEVFQGVMGKKNGTYYINAPFGNITRFRDIHVKVITKLGIQEEDVYNLHNTDVVQLQFYFGLKDRSRTSLFENHWGFPILGQILRFLLTNILI